MAVMYPPSMTAIVRPVSLSMRTIVARVAGRPWAEGLSLYTVTDLTPSAPMLLSWAGMKAYQPFTSASATAVRWGIIAEPVESSPKACSSISIILSMSSRPSMVCLSSSNAMVGNLQMLVWLLGLSKV